MIFVQNCTNTDIFIYTLHICLINIHMLCVYLQIIINSIVQLKLYMLK